MEELCSITLTTKLHETQLEIGAACFLSGAAGETVPFDIINNSDGFRFEHPFGHTFNFIYPKV